VPHLDNDTGFGAVADISFDRRGRVCIVVVAAGRFDLPPAGREGTAQPSEHQPPPPLQDEYHGDPATSSLRREGQSTYTRLGTDVHLLGHAWAPYGRACVATEVHLSVGPCCLTARVTGPRRWVRDILGARASAPEPFERVALRHEFAVGGPLESRNPVGRGLHGQAREAIDEPLPQLEHPAHPLRHWTERPPPVGFGPLARGWQPRAGFAGTYDTAWIEQRAPGWPDDFDLRFFQAASPPLVATPHLRGGESVRVSGTHPDGAWSFALPRIRLVARTSFRCSGLDVRPLRLDAVEIDTDAAALTMIWRASIPVRKDIFDHEVTFLRPLAVDEEWDV
jgi:hypothetical protein